MRRVMRAQGGQQCGGHVPFGEQGRLLRIVSFGDTGEGTAKVGRGRGEGNPGDDGDLLCCHVATL